MIATKTNLDMTVGTGDATLYTPRLPIQLNVASGKGQRELIVTYVPPPNTGSSSNEEYLQDDVKRQWNSFGVWSRR